jgi:hypothetical protein
MASFSLVPDAVSCAMSVQDAFAEHNREVPNDGLLLRIGLHAGEPIEEHGDLFGDAVNLAARLCAFVGPSEILVSETIRDMSVELGVPFEDLGTVKLRASRSASASSPSRGPSGGVRDQPSQRDAWPMLTQHSPGLGSSRIRNAWPRPRCSAMPPMKARLAVQTRSRWCSASRW